MERTKMHTIARRTLLVALIAGALGAPATAQTPTAPSPIGRWDLTVTGALGAYPSWLEVTLSGNRTLVGRYVAASGSARPISRVEFNDGNMRFAIPPQWEAENGDLRVEGQIDGDRLSGTLVTPGGERHTWTGVRAPSLVRAAAPRWGAPIQLFNGKTLAGWETRGGSSHWRAANGILTNSAGGANLVSTRTFRDFKLHLEVRYPQKGNSGVYLRGRHEVQVEDSGGDEPNSLKIGGVYGFLPPNQSPGTKAGQWVTYDITLVGRRVTVVINGTTMIADQIIPGITGGALDSDEGAPGPIYLQGDHTAVEYRNIRLTPAR